MRLDEVLNLNNNENFIFAVAFGYEGGYTHCTLLYKWEDQGIKTIEFSSEQCIKNNRTIGDLSQNEYIYVHYNDDLIFEDFALQVPSVCELIKEKNERINFGIKFTNTKFNNEGVLTFADGDWGLTCATFVLAILQRAGINTIKLSDWNTREADMVWQNRILEYYKEVNIENQNDYSADLLKHYEENIGCFRYMPQEVAASTAAKEMPIGIEYCQEYGERISMAFTCGIESYNKIYTV